MTYGLVPCRIKPNICIAHVHVHRDVYPGFPSERVRGRGAVWAKSGYLAQYRYEMLLARLGTGEGERANTRAGGRAKLYLRLASRRLVKVAPSQR